MNDFTFYTPTRYVFGRGVTDRVGAELATAGYRRALVVYGQGSAVRSGTLARVLASLDAASVAHVELGGVRPNPEIGLVRQGIELARAEGVDVLLPVGGGSAMDCAKAIGLGVPYEGDEWDFHCGRAKPSAHVPVAAVVTIPASGSEASNSCVISNDELGLKAGINTDFNRPVMAFLDPELTFTLPPYQTAAGVTDMISHIMERFFSGQPAAPATDNISCGLIRAAMEAAPRVLADPCDYDARATIMWVATLAHNGLCGLGTNIPGGRDGDWACHGLEHELSAYKTDITHGAGLAVIIPAWARHVWRSHPERFLEFGKQVFGIEPVDPEADGIEMTAEQAVEDAVLATIDELQAFFTSIGMPSTLGAFGLAEKDIEAMIPGLRATKGERFGSFQQLTLDDARAIYRAAL